MATQNSSGVASCVPSTLPCARLGAEPGRSTPSLLGGWTRSSGMSRLLEQVRLDRAADELGVAEAVPKVCLERPDGIQILRRAWIAPRLAGERRQHAAGEIGKLACRLASSRRICFEAYDAGHRAVDRPTIDKTQVPRVPLEALL